MLHTETAPARHKRPFTKHSNGDLTSLPDFNKVSAFTLRSSRMLNSNREYFESHVFFFIIIHDLGKPNWALLNISKDLPDPEPYSVRLFSSLGWIWGGIISPTSAAASAALLRVHQQKLFCLPVSVLRASPISLVWLTTHLPYLFQQLCCKNKITEPIRLLTAQLNTSWVRC